VIAGRMRVIGRSTTGERSTGGWWTTIGAWSVPARCAVILRSRVRGAGLDEQIWAQSL